MERNCFGFKEEKHNQCYCMILSEMICKKDIKPCHLYKNKDNVNLEQIEKEIVAYAKHKKEKN